MLSILFLSFQIVLADPIYEPIQKSWRPYCEKLLLEAESQAKLRPVDERSRTAVLDELVAVANMPGNQSVREEIKRRLPAEISGHVIDVIWREVAYGNAQHAFDRYREQSWFWNRDRNPFAYNELQEWANAYQIVERDGRSEVSRTCFTGSSRVLTPSGEREISALRPGDSIFSLDLSSGQLTLNRVKGLHRFVMGDKMSVRTASGARVQVNPRHHIYNADRGVWMPIGEMRVDTQLLRVKFDGQQFAVGPDAISDLKWESEREDLFDLELESSPHNFMVDGVLVHNRPILKLF